MVSPNHHVVPLDALSAEDLDRVKTDYLHRATGLAVITEGLLNYLDQPSLFALWQRIAHMLTDFPENRYLANIHIGVETSQMYNSMFFKLLLSLFTAAKGPDNLRTEADACNRLKDAGFDEARLHDASDLQRQDSFQKGVAFILDGFVKSPISLLRCISRHVTYN
ncbi:MAG: hypothetical protein SWH61_10995 [Thermodesulfobacteriota bacterium]|nr:hypothetical protein [Thermodesulfobacteriota bacterium]